MSVAVVASILVSAVVVLGGLVALTKAIWIAAQDMRDNKRATVANTAAIIDLSTKMDGRITSLEARMSNMEKKVL